MDKNQIEETETFPSSVQYVALFATTVAVGTLLGAGIVAGGEAVYAAKSKIQKLRKARAAKKTANEN